MKHIFIGIIIITTMALTGCSSASISDPSPRPSDTTPPTTASVVELITITASEIKILADDGAVDTFTYFQPAQDLIEALTVAFQAQPNRQKFEPELEPGNATATIWPGFMVYDEDAPAQSPDSRNYKVIVSSDEINGVGIETVEGVRVGDSAPDLQDRFPDNTQRLTAPGDSERLVLELGMIEVPETTNFPNGDLTFFVGITAQDPSGQVTEYEAPTPNQGS